MDLFPRYQKNADKYMTRRIESKSSEDTDDPLA
jgi:hypothetical protein